ncbi:peptidase M12 [Pseudomonas mandelii]|uniref:M12 family metallopeptidase n=1 Tax=Pseudomonas mandelii TaxID=75612 RepID=UPI000B96892B|nr:M12 family metallopeptidase [Pseudomonas mandelii]OYQ21045.1 peptidase M12 [Pseudomonas mandelii]
MFQTVVAAINQWAPHVNLKFEFIELDDNDELYDGDIRILLSHFKDGAGSSVIGTDARDILPHLPTMILGTDYQSSFFTVAAMHEFGHALGVEHEHQHPDAPLDWNLSALYRDSEARDNEASGNYLSSSARWAPTQIRQTPYDPKSIMHYAFPASVMRDKIEVP